LAVWPGVKHGQTTTKAFFPSGCFMSLHFQTYAEFSLTSGKPYLISTSISSTHAACTSIPFNPYPHKILTLSYIFPTEKIARSYIIHLHKVFPNSPAPPPVLDPSVRTSGQYIHSLKEPRRSLDGNQQELFPEVSK